jgi:hypothetical protein
VSQSAETAALRHCYGRSRYACARSAPEQASRARKAQWLKSKTIVWCLPSSSNSALCFQSIPMGSNSRFHFQPIQDPVIDPRSCSNVRDFNPGRSAPARPPQNDSRFYAQSAPRGPKRAPWPVDDGPWQRSKRQGIKIPKRAARLGGSVADIPIPIRRAIFRRLGLGHWVVPHSLQPQHSRHRRPVPRARERVHTSK